MDLEADVVKDREHGSALMWVSCIHDPHCITDLDSDSAAKTHKQILTISSH